MEDISFEKTSPRATVDAPGPGRDGFGADDGLARLRRELDAVDERLLNALRERIECCKRIAIHKLAHDIPMMQPGRISLVQDRAAAYARAHGMSPTFVRELYDRIIAETCRVEDLIIAGGTSGTGPSTNR